MPITRIPENKPVEPFDLPNLLDINKQKGNIKDHIVTVISKKQSQDGGLNMTQRSAAELGAEKLNKLRNEGRIFSDITYDSKENKMVAALGPEQAKKLGNRTFTHINLKTKIKGQKAETRTVKVDVIIRARTQDETRILNKTLNEFIKLLNAIKKEELKKENNQPTNQVISIGSCTIIRFQETKPSGSQKVTVIDKSKTPIESSLQNHENILDDQAASSKKASEAKKFQEKKELIHHIIEKANNTFDLNQSALQTADVRANELARKLMTQFIMTTGKS